MAKLNMKKVAEVVDRNRDYGLSYNGNLQFKKGPEQELVELAVSTLYGNDTFYETTAEKAKRLRDAVEALVRANKQEFVANVAVFARREMFIRTMPIVLIVELAAALRAHNKTLPGLKNAVVAVCERTDALTEMYAYSIAVFGDKGSVPLAIKKGIAEAFNKFDAYQFSKYNSDASVKLRDLLRIVHPVPKDEDQSAIFKGIMLQNLKPPYTWETELSANGQLPAAERKSPAVLWGELIASNKMGYMATLRNLRNIVQADVSPEMRLKVAQYLSNPEAVAKSKQFPFAFVKAARALDETFAKPSFGFRGRATTKAVNSDQFMTAISTALDLSCNNMPHLGNNVLIIIDCSGSMQSGNNDGNMGPFETACLLAAAAVKSNSFATNLATIMFSDTAELITGLRRTDSVLSIFEKLISHNKGGGTNLQAALNMTPKLGFKPDVVLCLSDMQVNQLSGSNAANTCFSNTALKIAFNLNAYNTTPMHETDGWLQLYGWSDRVFKFVEMKREAQSLVEKLMTSKLY